MRLKETQRNKITLMEAALKAGCRRMGVKVRAVIKNTDRIKYLLNKCENTTGRTRVDERKMVMLIELLSIRKVIDNHCRQDKN